MSVTEEFHALAERIVDDLLEADPVGATSLGDHRFDDRLPDLSANAVEARVRTMDDHLTALDAVDDVELDVTDLVDLEILRARLLRSVFEIRDIRRQEWDPMVWNPGTALHLLMSRDFAPAEERAASLRGRLAAVPELLSAARSELSDMSALHVETALAQLEGTRRLIDTDARRLVDEQVADDAVEAVADFSGWLTERLPQSTRSPRLGELVYGGALWHAMDDDTSAELLLTDARAHLDLLGEQLAHAARAYLGPQAPVSDDEAVRTALERVASQAVVTDATLLPLMAGALERTTAFVRERELVTVPDVEVRLIDMPEIHRGVAVAYCDAPGPLESAAVATYVAVAPTPPDWDEERIGSFYREYNGVQLHNLTVHEAMPGHVLQLAHAQRLASPTRVRRFGRSGVFVEGWAVYSEELHGRARLRAR